jgi:hypothetical protein
MRDFLRRNADKIAMVFGILAMFGAVIALVVYVNDQERDAAQRERTTEQATFVKSELAAERIVIGSQVAACERNAQNAANDMNSWYEVDLADFRVAESPETKPESAHIRLVEAEGIDREEIRRATRLDYHYARELHSPEWRHASQKARFSCTKAFPLP